MEEKSPAVLGQKCSFLSECYAYKYLGKINGNDSYILHRHCIDHCQVDNCPHRDEAMVELSRLIRPPDYSHLIIVAPRRRLTCTSKALVLSAFWVEKPRSTVARAIPEWCREYQKRIEATRKDYLLLIQQKETPEASKGQVAMGMSDNRDLVQKQLSELAQQIIHVIQACNDEKDILQEEFDFVRNGSIIMESRLQMEKTRIDAEVSGVGLVMHFQQAILEEVRSGKHFFQEQDN